MGGDVDRSPVVIDRLFSNFRMDWRLYGGTQVFDQVFSAVNAARTGETLTRVQRVAAQNAGLSFQLSTVYRSHTLVGGVELRNIRGSSDEIAFANNRPTALIDAGGREQTSGVFIQDFAKIGKNLIIAAGLRYDRWSNYAGFSSTRPLSTNQTATTNFPDRDEDAVSPRLSALLHLSDEVSFYASVSRSFRSPTLNELYRAFRVGNVLTLANENLRAERANNIEAGISFNRKRFNWRTSGFWTSISQPVANVTLSSTQGIITRQRQNAGRTTSRGFETEAEIGFNRIGISGGYLFADSRLSRFPSNIQLEGRVIPQVPRHQLTFQTRYSEDKWTLAVQARASSAQFDDDLNLFRLEPYIQIDVFASRRLNESLKIYAALENIFNSRYSIGRTPIRSVSSPLNFRLGIRFR